MSTNTVYCYSVDNGESWHGNYVERAYAYISALRACDDMDVFITAERPSFGLEPKERRQHIKGQPYSDEVIL